ncbi:hypothetical protein Glove_688g17 [Diversispora epigaea]|uniref:Uncharacterized protein n=1 Tax=Diversispora epigaea TaxID=1348612 RepID=A0A397G6F0_9GLOM|nr:hypothetical protein Glove_688g17 [Diversispora epigaea]
MSEFKNISTLLIPNSHCQSYISQPVLIFPEEMLNEEPMSMEDECNYSTPSHLDRKINRYRKLRAMHERAGRLPKSPISENNNESRNTSTSSNRSTSSSNCGSYSNSNNS